LKQAKADAQNFASQRYTTTLDADKTPFDTAYTDADTKLQKFGADRSTATVAVDDTDAVLKLDDVKFKLDTIAHDRSTATVRVDDSGSHAALSRAHDDLTKLHDDEIRAKDVTDALGRSLTDAGRVGSNALRDLLTNSNGTSGGLDNLGRSASGAANAAGSGSGGAPGLMEVAIALAPTLAPIAAIASGVGLALATMFTAATAGVGAFFLAASAGGGKNGSLSAMATAMAYVSFQMAAWAQQLGPIILPALSALAHLAGPFFQSLTPLVAAGAGALSQFAGYMEKAFASPSFKTFIGFLAAQAGPAFMTFVKLLGDFGKGLGTMMEQAAPLLPGIEKGLLAIGNAFVKFAASNQFRGFIQYVIQNGPMIATLFEDILKNVLQLAVAVAPLGITMIHLFEGVEPAIHVVIGALGWILKPLSAFSESFSTLGSNFAQVFIQIGQDIVNWWNDVWSAVFSPVINFFTNTIPHTLSVMSGFFTSVWSDIATVVVGAWNTVYGYVIAPVVDFFTNTIPHALGVVGGFFSSVWNGISGAVTSAWDTVNRVVISPLVHFFTGDIPQALQSLESVFSSVWATISGVFTSTWNGIYSGFISPLINFFTTDIPNGISKAVGFFTGLPGKIVSAVGSGLTVLAQWGLDIVNGIANAITGAAKTIWDALTGVITSAISHVKAAVNSIPVIGSALSAIGLASGGLVTKPTFALVGEAGPEVVIPLADLTAGFASGIAPGLAGIQAALMGKGSATLGPSILSPPTSSSGGGAPGPSIVFAPQLLVNGDPTPATIARMQGMIDANSETFLQLLRARMPA